MEKNAKNGTFFLKERKRTERSFEKNRCPTLHCHLINVKVSRQIFCWITTGDTRFDHEPCHTNLSGTTSTSSEYPHLCSHSVTIYSQCPHLFSHSVPTCSQCPKLVTVLLLSHTILTVSSLHLVTVSSFFHSRVCRFFPLCICRFFADIIWGNSKL